MLSLTSLLRTGSRPMCLTLFLAVAFLPVIFLPATVLGQAYFGTVNGVLTDPSGAVVQGAKVVLADQQKGYTFNTKSDSDGRYLFRSIPPGLYAVSAEIKGFQKTQSTSFKVDINENATANLTLKIAAGVEAVSVEARAQNIQTEDAETGQVVNRRFINDLPLIDRYVVALAALAPGVTEMDDQCSEFAGGGSCTGTNFVSNGSRGSTADILSDGASVTNSEPNGGITAATYLPSPEAVEEFKVEQTNFSAEYGFSGASVVNMITRSGTNAFHGGVYNFSRDQFTDANNWFNDRYGIPIPHVRRNDYGVTIGGPIIKNKTFFFFDYEGTRSASLGTAQAGVPSDAMRAGDFGAVCPANGNTDNNGNYHPGAWDSTVGSANYGMCVQADDPTMTTLVGAGQIWDPYQRNYDPNVGAATWTSQKAFIPFNNIGTYISPGCTPTVVQPCPTGQGEPTPGVAGNLIDPVAKTMLSYFPEPNISAAAGGTIYWNWIASGANHGYNDQFDIKVDHRFSQKNLVSVKYSQQWSHGSSFNCFGNFTDPCEGGPNETGAHVFAINDTHTFTPTLLLNATLGFSRGAWNIDAYNPQGVSNPLSKLGFPSYLNSNGFEGVPPIFLSNYFSAGFSDIGTDPYGNCRLGQDTGQLTVALDKVHGPHDMKFGFDGRLHQMNYIQTNAPNGYFSFDTTGSGSCPATSSPNYGNTGIQYCGGDAMASFLMGTMNSNSYYEIQDRPAMENYQYGFFALDNWKVSHKLTLNLGLRWDVTLARTDRYNRMDWFDPNATSPLNNGSLSYTDQFSGPTTLQLKGGEVFATPGARSTYTTDWSNLQPRFGLAFQFAPKMVFRGGYGIYYGQSRSGVTGVQPYGGQGFNQYTNVINTYENLGAVPYLHLSDPFPNGLIQPAGNSLGLLNDIGYGANGPLRTASANLTPREQSWSIGIERELPGNVLINAEYIGKTGTHLPFSGSNYIDHLGSFVENPSTNVNNLLTYVSNPFSSMNGGPISDPNSVLSAPSLQEYNLLLPWTQFTGVTIEPQMIANSSYNGLQLAAEKRYSNGLQFLVTFVWSKSIDDASQADDNVTWTGSFTSLQDPNKPWLERSLSTFDIPYVVQFSYTYDLPFGRGKMLLGKIPGWANAVIGGWKTNGIWRDADGRPMTFFLADGIPLPTYAGQRPLLVGKPKKNPGDWVDQYFADPSTNVFQRTPDFTLSNAPRAYGGLRTPWSFTTDLSLAKQISMARVREDMNLELRIEARNAFNHPVFGTPDTTVDDPSFGQISYTSQGPREIQLAIKFNF
jgi:hypothetical protein